MRALVAVAIALVAVVPGCSRDRAHAPAVATRVVSLGPATTEALFAVGAGGSVVGRSQYCDWPPEAAKLPAVGGIEPDVEAILELRPDLVVGPSGAWSGKLTQTLDAHGIASWFPGEVRTLLEVDGLVSTLGARTGHADGAARVVANLDASERAVDRAVEHAPRPRGRSPAPAPAMARGRARPGAGRAARGPSRAPPRGAARARAPRAPRPREARAAGRARRRWRPRDRSSPRAGPTSRTPAS